MRRLGLALPLVLALTAPVVAQQADVPALVKLVDNQPADMDRSTWKEKRRDAARKLGQSKDKRATPALVKLAETETFDIVGEIAIEGLGNLGDPAAVPVLQKIANDPARDKAQRDLAKKSLGKLGASADGKPPAPTPTPPPPPPDVPIGTGDLGDAKAKPPAPTPIPAAAAGSSLLDGGAATDLPELPALPDDTLAAYERVTFALGTASTEYDTVRKRLSFDFDVAGAYQKRVEREAMAWGWDATAHVVAGFINPTGRAQVRGTQVDVTADGEARFYAGKLYGVGKAIAGLQVTYFSAKDGADPTQDDDNTRTTADFQIALGGGYGRLLDVGGAIRVRRLSRTLDAAHALGKPIDAAIAKQLELTWWALRNERSSYRALVATVEILRKGGILLTEPDAGLAYELLTVLRDSQLFQRPSGLDLQLVVSEGYLRRPDTGDVPASGEEGRVEQVLASAGYGAQLADDKLEISGNAYARLRVLAPDTQPSPWAIGTGARLRRFTYGDHGDPLGAIDLAGQIELSDANADFMDPMQESDLGLRISGQLGFTYFMNQASGLRLAATVAADGSELFVGAQLQATYGLLDGTFSGL